MRALVIIRHGPPEVLQVRKRPDRRKPIGHKYAADIEALYA
jgi:hypothetical protein